MEVVSINRAKRELLRKRTYAFTADIFLISIINKLLITTYINLLEVIMYHYPIHIQRSLILSLNSIQTITLIAIFSLYFFISYSFGNGQTPGKAIFNIYVKGKNEKLTTWECLSRTFGYFLCYALGLILYLVPFFRKDRRGIPDFISQTNVKMNISKKEVHEKQIDLFDKAA